MSTPSSEIKAISLEDLPKIEDTFGGKVLGNYLLEERIGIGATSIVYRAVHTQLDRKYAVKILHPSIAIRPGMRERFLREAKMAGQLKHENIIFIADFAAEQEIGPYMVMEYLHGETLQSVLQREKRLSLALTVAIMTQVCSALAEAHKHGIIHRDLKPENIFLVKRENASDLVKILDFGIARLVQNEVSLTGEGHILGTPLYMSPEQCRGNTELTPASDIYSLGVVLFEMLVGETPFTGDNPQKLLLDHFLLDPPELPYEFPSSLRQLQSEFLSKEPQERPSDLDHVCTRLVQTLEDPYLDNPFLSPSEESHTREQLPAIDSHHNVPSSQIEDNYYTQEQLPSAERPRSMTSVSPEQLLQESVRQSPIWGQEQSMPNWNPFDTQNPSQIVSNHSMNSYSLQTQHPQRQEEQPPELVSPSNRTLTFQQIVDQTQHRSKQPIRVQKSTALHQETYSKEAQQPSAKPDLLLQDLEQIFATPLAKVEVFRMGEHLEDGNEDWISPSDEEDTPPISPPKKQSHLVEEPFVPEDYEEGDSLTLIVKREKQTSSTLLISLISLLALVTILLIFYYLFYM